MQCIAHYLYSSLYVCMYSTSTRAIFFTRFVFTSALIICTLKCSFSTGPQASRAGGHRDPFGHYGCGFSTGALTLISPPYIQYSKFTWSVCVSRIDFDLLFRFISTVHARRWSWSRWLNCTRWSGARKCLAPWWAGSRSGCSSPTSWPRPRSSSVLYPLLSYPHVLHSINVYFYISDNQFILILVYILVRIHSYHKLNLKIHIELEVPRATNIRYKLTMLQYKYEMTPSTALAVSHEITWENNLYLYRLIVFSLLILYS